MRLLVIAAIAVAAASSAHSETATDICGRAEKLAEQIMTYRQKNVSASKLATTMSEVQPQRSQRLITDMVVSAYEVPRFSVEENQKEAVADFANEAFVRCMGAF